MTAAVLAGVAVLAGCSAPYPLHARMSEDAIRAVLDENFREGMRPDQVEQRLTDLRVAERDRVRYNLDAAPAIGAAPPQLLARVYEAGGFWVQGRDDTVRVTDVVFVFDGALRLECSEIRSYRLRYFDNVLATRLPYEPAYKPRRAPHKPPPPKQPPVEEACP